MANNKDFKVKNGLSAPTIKEKATVDVTLEDQPGYAGKRATAETQEDYLVLSGLLDNSTIDGATYTIADTTYLPTTGSSNSLYVQPNGEALYVGAAGSNNINRVIKIPMTTPYKLDTLDSANASYVAISSTHLDEWGGITFAPDGTHFLTTEGTFVFEWVYNPANGPWEIANFSSGSSTDFQSLSGLSPASTLSGVTYGDSGTKLYVVDNLTDTICQANLSTPYDYSSITSSSSVKPYAGMYDPNAESNAATPWSTGLNQMRQIKFSEDGTLAFITDGSGQVKVWVFELSTPWEIATMRRPALKSYLSIAYIDNTTRDIKDIFFMTPTDLVILDQTDEILYADLSGNKADLNLSTSTSFNITLNKIGEYHGADLNLGVSIENTYNAGGHYINGVVDMKRTKGDLKINLIADGEHENQNAVVTIENELSAWPLHALHYRLDTTPTGDINGPVSPRGHRMSDDGTTFWIIDQDNATGQNRIYSYALSTPWDISTINSTAFNTTTFSSQDATTIDFTFGGSIPGSKLFVTGNTNNRLYEYTLSTPYDISTRTYQGFLDIGAQYTDPKSFLFNPEGTKGYYFGGNANVYGYDFSTPFDTSTAIYNNFNTSGFGSTPVRWGPNGKSLYDTSNGEYIREWILLEPYNPFSAVYSHDNGAGTPQINRHTYIGNMIGTSTGYCTTFAITDTGEVRAYTLNPNTGSPWTIWQMECDTPTINWPNNIYWKDGAAPEVPAYGETDVYVLNTTNGGHTYNGVVAIDGAK